MKKKINVYKLILVIFVVYCITIIIKQQTRLNSYSTEKNYYKSQIEDLEEKQKDLTQTQENVNSPEYIESIAREKLEMYYPNEKVFVDINK